MILVIVLLFIITYIAVGFGLARRATPALWVHAKELGYNRLITNRIWYVRIWFLSIAVFWPPLLMSILSYRAFKYLVSNPFDRMLERLDTKEIEPDRGPTYSSVRSYHDPYS